MLTNHKEKPPSSSFPSPQHSNNLDLPPLRNYQIRACKRIFGKLEAAKTNSDQKHYGVQMATGTGKTAVIAALSYCLPFPFKRVLILATRDKIRRQLTEALDPYHESSIWGKISCKPKEAIRPK